MKRNRLLDLDAFMAVAEKRSFTRAAADLDLSQSALSHTIRRLEARLGVRLLTRTSRSVAPTEAGERLLRTLRPAIDRIDVELQSIGELRERPAGTIRITTSDHAARTCLWPALRGMLRDYPEVKIELHIDNGFIDLAGEGFDAGVRLGEALARDMIAVRIGPDLRMAIVGSPDYFARHPAPRAPQDLTDHACINLRMNSSGGLYVWELEKNDRALRIRVDGQLTFNDSALMVQAAIDGYGLAHVVEDQAAAPLADGRLIRVLDDWCAPFAGHHLYYPSRRQHSAAFQLLIRTLRFPRADAAL